MGAVRLNLIPTYFYNKRPVKNETAKSVQVTVFSNDLYHHGVPSRETHVLLTSFDVKYRWALFC